ncbi:hypothetical protein [Labrenzia sp. THAF82]|uniref:hypothetical protein n=1 Tax=Labrenzia sp. THAF82 TaxID=2587861 RepID=UPI001267ED46|nr:hypothetical protein [Labrenzia sp. THAF82]
MPSIVADEVNALMEVFLDGVRRDFAAEELHFTEIWSGQGPWKSVMPGKRAEMMELMANLMKSFSLPIVHQTVSDSTLNDHPDIWRSLDSKRVGDWRLDDISHFGLLLLCSKTSKHLRTMKAASPTDFNLPVPLYIDEGLMPAGGERELPNWSDVIEGPKANFRRSTELVGIQLADFAAFVINRVQWAAVKRQPGPTLEPAEELIFRAAAGLNILNLSIGTTSWEELGRESYEDLLADDRMAKGLPPRPYGGKSGPDGR